MKKNLFSYLLPAAAIMALAGCSATTSDVGVYLSEEIQTSESGCPTMEVDVVGVTEAEEKRLLAYDVDRYFAPPATFRKSLGAITLKFSATDTNPKIIPSNAVIWDRWADKGAKYIAVISNLPMLVNPEDSAVDPRKLIINMNDGYFVDSSVHYIEVGGSGIIELKNPPASPNAEKLK